VSALRGAVVGMLTLTALEATVSSKDSAGNVSTLIGLAAAAVNRIVDPSVPLIPDLRKKAS
jgi:hypothetical protein